MFLKCFLYGSILILCQMFSVCVVCIYSLVMVVHLVQTRDEKGYVRSRCFMSSPSFLQRTQKGSSPTTLFFVKGLEICCGIEKAIAVVVYNGWLSLNFALEKIIPRWRESSSKLLKYKIIFLILTIILKFWCCDKLFCILILIYTDPSPTSQVLDVDSSELAPVNLVILSLSLSLSQHQIGSFAQHCLWMGAKARGANLQSKSL